MSTVQTNEIRAPGWNNHSVTMPSGTWIEAPGQVIQTVWRRFDYPTYYSLPAGSGANGTILNGLNVTITKKNPNSYCYIQWWLFYETHHDVVFRCFRDGSLLNNGTYRGYNASVGIVPYSGITSAEYEHSFDNNSTPSVLHMAMIDRNVTAAAMTYQLAAIGGTTTYNIMVNQPTNQTGQDSYERGVSWAMIEEIAYF